MKKLLKIFFLFSILFASTVVFNFAESEAASFNAEMEKKYEHYLEDNIYANNCYSFSLPSSGALYIEMQVLNFYDCSISILNQSGKELWKEYCGEGKEIYVIDLIAGNYTLKIGHDNGGGNYCLKINFKTANESFYDDGTNYMYQAPNIDIGLNNYYGHLAQNDSKDLFCFKVVKDGKYIIDLTVLNFHDCGVSVLNQGGDSLWHEYFGEGRKIQTIELKKGTYYLEISKDNGTGNYSFCLDFFSSKYCSHENKQTVIKSTYIKKGYTLNICEECGKSYKNNYIAKKKLGRSIISIYSRGGKGKIYLWWHPVSDASGYQIRYCRNKAMKKGVKTKTVKGRSKYKKTIKRLSRKKKYYVQVRAYRKSGSKIIYGKWSAKRCIKTK